MYGRSKTTTPNLRRPSSPIRGSRRGIGLIVLTVLLPPIGLMLIWYTGAFESRGRMAMTALAVVEMTLLGVLLTPRAQLVAQAPVPVAPVAVTHAPTEDNLSALYNIEELLYEQQLAQVVAQGGSESDIIDNNPQADAQREARREEVLNTIVYCVYRNAQRYHAQMVCGTQSNRRALTVREAMLEALSPCPDCNPPVWTE